MYSCFLNVKLMNGDNNSPGYLRTPALPYPRTRCGSQLPPVVSSTTNELSIMLRTDGSVSHRGFYAHWTTDEPTGGLEWRF